MFWNPPSRDVFKGSHVSFLQFLVDFRTQESLELINEEVNGQPDVIILQYFMAFYKGSTLKHSP